jgi:MYXO-CTERM domain-containing protein
MKLRNAFAAFALASAVGLCAHAAVSFGNFEDNTTDGFASLGNSGVQPWASPVAGAVVTPSSSGLAGSKVLELTGNPSFNFGQASGAALGYDFLANNLRAAFLANNAIEFDWVAVPNGATAGFSQLYNVILNSQGGGFVNVGGYSTGDNNENVGYFNGYTGPTHHVVINYSAYKANVLASANPDGGGWLQFGIQPNAGGGAPADMYFDNFQFTTVPEPASLGLAGLTALGLIRRRSA